MRYEIPQFLVYIIRSERILKSRSENFEKLGKDLVNYDLSSGSGKNTFTGLKTPQNCFFPSHLFLRPSWTKVLGHFCISRRFPMQTGPTPPLTPQTMLDACIQNFFRVSTLYRVGGGRTARKFRKRCTVLRGNREITENMNIAVLSQGLLSRIVAMKSGQVREGKSNTAGSPFLPRRKESTAIAWSIAHQ